MFSNKIFHHPRPLIEYKNLVIFFNFKPEQQHSLERQVGMHYTFLTSASAPPPAFFSVRHGSLSQFSRSVLKVSSFGLTLTQDEEEWRTNIGKEKVFVLSSQQPSEEDFCLGNVGQILLQLPCAN